VTAAIMAGGFGTRIHHLTGNPPKSMIAGGLRATRREKVAGGLTEMAHG
jgi:hypothetical protein